MTDAEKLTSVKSVLGITGSDEDTSLSAYLALAEAEILAWLYSGNTPDDVTDVPTRYEVTQIMGVVAGFNMQGVEGQTSHSENGISRSWKHEDMVAYLRTHVIPYAVVI